MALNCKNTATPHSAPEDFWTAFDFAIVQKMSHALAMLFCKKYSSMGKTDASEGFCFYALNLMSGRG